MPIARLEPAAWGECALEDGEIRRFSIGRLTLHCRRDGDEILLASEKDDDSRPNDTDLLWYRWAVKEGVTTLHLAPRLPDRPVVVGPEQPFHVAPGAEARIFVMVPLVAAVELSSGGNADEPVVLREFPTETLSQTWFGELEDGELCYWLPTIARREVEATPGEDAPRVRAPVRIVNGSTDVLPVSRVCLRVGGLALYEKDGVLWSNETRAVFRGGAARSEITIRRGPPPEAAGGRRVGFRREAPATGLVARTFRSLQRLSLWPGDED
ncbi:MAG: DUF432 domain-containing protein [Verrucomicrobiae bacterium]|nr:DUF432 domain-containing protein [Verrucomicrobiae bacterium]MCP5540444.1 DUF432 domain-containing protein [Akkermansiaceae bacterium]